MSHGINYYICKSLQTEVSAKQQNFCFFLQCILIVFLFSVLFTVLTLTRYIVLRGNGGGTEAFGLLGSKEKGNAKSKGRKLNLK